MKRFHHFESLETAMSTKFSCNADNNKYIVGGGLVNNTEISDVPEVDWQCIVYVKDAGLMWTHGQWYCGGMITVKYDQLVYMKTNGALISGAQYRIVDYDFVSSISGIISGNHKFDIVVTATSSNTLSEEACALYNDDDTYFDDCDICGWKLWYCLDNDSTRFDWADAVEGKGVIYRMIDEWGNDCPYDFKNAKFWDDDADAEVYTFCAYDRTALDEMVDLSVVANTNDYINTGSIYAHVLVGVYNNVIESRISDSGMMTLSAPKFVCNDANYVEDKGFQGIYNNRVIGGNKFGYNIGNCSIMSGGVEIGCYVKNVTIDIFSTDIVIGDRVDNVSIGKNCDIVEVHSSSSRITIGDFCGSIVVGASCCDVVIGNSNANVQLEGYNTNITMGSNNDTITVGSYTDNNSFGNSCENITVGQHCDGNVFGDYCTGITTNSSCTCNTFGAYCGYDYSSTNPVSYGNIILSQYCKNNTIGSGCYDITLESSVKNNIICDWCHNITIGLSGKENYVGQGCVSITLDDGCGDNTFGQGCIAITLGTYCDGNTFGQHGSNITLGGYCDGNKFGHNCSEITLGSYCSYNVYGQYCKYIYMTQSASATGTILGYCQYNVFEPGSCYYTIYCSSGTSSTAILQNLRVHKGSQTSTSYVAVNTTNNPNEYYIGSMQMSSNFYALGLYETSDESLKDFSDKVVVDFDKLAKLKKNYFTWKDSDDKSRQIGVSAQEIQEIYPEIVSDNNGTLTVAYDKLSVIALAAVDMLSERLSSIENRLNAIDGLSK